MDIKPRRKRCEKGILRRKTERRKCYPQEIPEDKILLTFCPQTYHLLWIKIFSISAHLPTLFKKLITGAGVKSNGYNVIINLFFVGIDIFIELAYNNSGRQETALKSSPLPVMRKINRPCKRGSLPVMRIINRP